VINPERKRKEESVKKIENEGKIHEKIGGKTERETEKDGKIEKVY
jgi:hypothetical protein